MQLQPVAPLLLNPPLIQRKGFFTQILLLIYVTDTKRISLLLVFQRKIILFLHFDSDWIRNLSAWNLYQRNFSIVRNIFKLSIYKHKFRGHKVYKHLAT